MSAQHTPGPWLAEGGKVFAETGRFFDNPVAIVGVPLGKNDSRFGELEANARLIAAAPDLLEALQVARRWMRSGECNCYQATNPDKFKADEAMVEAVISKTVGQKGSYE